MKAPASAKPLDFARDAALPIGSRCVRRLISASPIGVERLLRRAGFAAYRAAAPKVIEGHPLFACWIEMPDVSQERLLAHASGFNVATPDSSVAALP